MLQFRTVPKLNSLYLLVVVEWSKIKQTEKIVFGRFVERVWKGQM